jgi:hypothetical protein
MKKLLILLSHFISLSHFVSNCFGIKLCLNLLKMIPIKTNELHIYKKCFNLLKFIFQILCFGILFYQFIDITNVYLNFPHEVKLDIKDYSGLTLPSITFCLKRDHFWLKEKFESKKKFIYLTNFINFFF